MQNVGELIASYFTQLKQLAKTCEFADEDLEKIANNPALYVIKI